MISFISAMGKVLRKSRLLSDARASEIAEAALVFPLVFMLLLGIYWFGRAFDIYATINHAAREGARAAVAQTCATCGNQSPTLVLVSNTVTQALQASSVSPSQIQQFPATLPANTCAGVTESCSLSTSNVTVCTNAPLTPAAGLYPQVCGVSVSFEYPYQFSLPFTSLNQQQFLLKADVQMKGEY
jgi:Flp pilus assembly protein TadG